MKQSLAHIGSTTLIALALVACGSENSRSNGGKGNKGKQIEVPPKVEPTKGPSKGEQLPSKEGEEQKLPKKEGEEQKLPPPPASEQQKPPSQEQQPVQQKGGKPIPPKSNQKPSPGQQLPLPGGEFPPMDDALPPAQDGGFQYTPITHLNICLNTEPNADFPLGYQTCTGMFGADGVVHGSQLNIGDAHQDLKSIGISVAAMSVPGASPMTALDLCLNAEGGENRCTGYQQFVDGTEFSTGYAVGDGMRDVDSASISAKAYYAPNGLPITRINVCIAGEDRFVCTGDVLADGLTRTSPFSFGDNQNNLNTIALKFSSLSY